MTVAHPPWESETTATFLSQFVPYRNFLRNVEATLQYDPQERPHEIRAAVAVVIMLCRENLWPTNQGTEQRDQIVHLAARKLTRLKQLYEYRGKRKPELQGNPMFRRMLTTLEEELRILESRLSDPKPQMPPQPPCSWGNFWLP